MRNSHLRLRRVLGHLGFAIVTLLVISVITFAAANLKSSRDVARGVLGREATPAQLDAFAREHGLNDPFLERYGSWLQDFTSGNWGTSPVTNRRVSSDVLPRLRNTLILTLVSLLFAIPLSIGLAVYMARRRGKARSLLLVIATIVVASLPEFFLGICLLMVFAIKLQWLPVDSTALAYGSMGAKIEAYILPALTLTLAVVPHVTRISYASASEALAAPSVQAARLRGLSSTRVTWDYAMRNAAVPIVNAVAVNIVYLLGGVIVVENVFAFAGVGQLLVQAIGSGDTPTIQAIALLLAASFIGISLLADLLVVHFNPRLRASHA